MISSEHFEDIKGGLKAVGLATAAERLSLEDFTPVPSASSALSADYLHVFDQLIVRLRELDNGIVMRRCTSMSEIFGVISPRCPYFSHQASDAVVKLLPFLISQIQAEQLIQSTTVNDENADKAVRSELLTEDDVKHTMSVEDKLEDIDDVTLDEKLRLRFQLGKLCKLFRPNTAVATDGSDSHQSTEGVLLDVIGSHLTDMLLGPSLMAMESIPGVLHSIQCKDATSSSHRKLSVAEMEQSIYRDFQLRRVMLMKRLEVTIESFLWSDKASMRETDIRSALRIQQSYLTEAPMYYTLQDALDAKVTLLHEHSKKITGVAVHQQLDAHSDVKSVVKRILVGVVPDRGGRANEVRPKQIADLKKSSFGPQNSSGGKSGATNSSTKSANTNPPRNSGRKVKITSPSADAAALSKSSKEVNKKSKN